MAAFQNTVTIAQPPDEVPAWNYAIARTVQTSPGQAGVSATYGTTQDQALCELI
jgi:hypothetical protein